jgi:hypothetical protein
MYKKMVDTVLKTTAGNYAAMDSHRNRQQGEFIRWDYCWTPNCDHHACAKGIYPVRAC